MQIRYPEHSIADASFELRDGQTLRDIITTCRDNAIPFQIRYNHGGKFKYHCDPCRTSR
jgi:hypothetical protein